MIKVFILTVHMAGGFSMIPFDSEINCLIAAAMLSPAVVTEATCYPAELIIQGSRYAPEMAPVPPHKPGMSV